MTSTSAKSLLIAGLLAPALAMIQPPGSAASTWRLVAVAQPLIHEGMFLTIGDVHYRLEDFISGTEVALTCEPNSIRTVGEDPEVDVEDLNAASKFGMSLEMGPIPENVTAIDTLSVTLDAARLGHALAAYVGRPCSPDTIVEATILCIRMNAARTQPPTKFVKLRVLGPPSLQRLTRVYPVIGPTAQPMFPGRSFDTCAPADKKETPRTR